MGFCGLFTGCIVPALACLSVTFCAESVAKRYAHGCGETRQAVSQDVACGLLSCDSVQRYFYTARQNGWREHCTRAATRAAEPDRDFRLQRTAGSHFTCFHSTIVQLSVATSLQMFEMLAADTNSVASFDELVKIWNADYSATHIKWKHAHGKMEEFLGVSAPHAAAPAAQSMGSLNCRLALVIGCTCAQLCRQCASWSTCSKQRANCVN